ncbi:WbqC-like protein family [Candidatus Magnetobacterium bavaricum]|uniref:WbqC-like protein family n=1 Tax=Candidatus Magnetobacterium bavaricum TaxID=29290 RepID=A0A0F3GJS0_9BACT|nr:WbqC-like protein family [Candidatus Magnetobacterium bavaricum]
MIVTIHQPEHLPWIGIFDKIFQTDVFVLLDHVQFTKNYFHNRNRIRTSQGLQWITVPVRHTGMNTPLNRIEIADNTVWRKKYWRSIELNYKRAPFFGKYRDSLHDIINMDCNLLIDINVSYMKYAMSVFELTPTLIRSSELPIDQTLSSSDLILNICKLLGASVYISGINGRNYLKEEEFLKNAISVQYQQFIHPEYTQMYYPFIPNASSVDFFFNLGNRAKDILHNRGIHE